MAEAERQGAQDAHLGAAGVERHEALRLHPRREASVGAAAHVEALQVAARVELVGIQAEVGPLEPDLAHEVAADGEEAHLDLDLDLHGLAQLFQQALNALMNLGGLHDDHVARGVAHDECTAGGGLRGPGRARCATESAGCESTTAERFARRAAKASAPCAADAAGPRLGRNALEGVDPTRVIGVFPGAAPAGLLDEQDQVLGAAAEFTHYDAALAAAVAAATAAATAAAIAATTAAPAAELRLTGKLVTGVTAAAAGPTAGAAAALAEPATAAPATRAAAEVKAGADVADLILGAQQQVADGVVAPLVDTNPLGRADLDDAVLDLPGHARQVAYLLQRVLHRGLFHVQRDRRAVRRHVLAPEGEADVAELLEEVDGLDQRRVLERDRNFLLQVIVDGLVRGRPVDRHPLRRIGHRNPLQDRVLPEGLLGVVEQALGSDFSLAGEPLGDEASARALRVDPLHLVFVFRIADPLAQYLDDLIARVDHLHVVNRTLGFLEAGVRHQVGDCLGGACLLPPLIRRDALDLALLGDLGLALAHGGQLAPVALVVLLHLRDELLHGRLFAAHVGVGREVADGELGLLQVLQRAPVVVLGVELLGGGDGVAQALAGGLQTDGHEAGPDLLLLDDDEAFHVELEAGLGSQVIGQGVLGVQAQRTLGQVEGLLRLLLDVEQVLGLLGELGGFGLPGLDLDGPLGAELLEELGFRHAGRGLGRGGGHVGRCRLCLLLGERLQLADGRGLARRLVSSVREGRHAHQTHKAERHLCDLPKHSPPPVTCSCLRGERRPLDIRSETRPSQVLFPGRAESPLLGRKTAPLSRKTCRQTDRPTRTPFGRPDETHMWSRKAFVFE